MGSRKVTCGMRPERSRSREHQRGRERGRDGSSVAATDLQPPRRRVPTPPRAIRPESMRGRKATSQPPGGPPRPSLLWRVGSGFWGWAHDGDHVNGHIHLLESGHVATYNLSAGDAYGEWWLEGDAMVISFGRCRHWCILDSDYLSFTVVHREMRSGEAARPVRAGLARTRGFWLESL